MRKIDKLKNIQRANMLSEQRFLKTKGLLTENETDNNIAVMIKKDGDKFSTVKGNVTPTKIGFVITQADDDPRWNKKPFQIIWDNELNSFINGESQWHTKEIVTPAKGHETLFSQLESKFKKTDTTKASDTYFNTLSEALDHVRQMARQLGYEVDEDAMWSNFGTGGISYGETKKGNIPLLKNGEPVLSKSGKELNRAMSIAIYRMDSGRYELTAYPTF